MTVPASHYYIQYKENDKGLKYIYICLIDKYLHCILVDNQTEFKRSYSVSHDRTIVVNSLEPGKTYTVILVASDGILAETKSDPQMVTILSKGMYYFILFFFLFNISLENYSN
jgi:hypothetical protein